MKSLFLFLFYVALGTLFNVACAWVGFVRGDP
jgi:hypothetical protein